MNIKQKDSYKLFGMLGALVVFSSVLASLLFVSHNVYAWCDENAGFDDRCSSENYESFKPLAEKRGVSYEKYQSMARSCAGGNPGGIDFGSVDEGSCINAAASCIQKSVSLDKCTADNMATLAMNDECNHGKLYSSGSSCNRLEEMNEDAFQEAEDARAKKAADSCTVSGSETEKFDQREACKKSVTDACSASNSSYGDNKGYADYKYDEYNKCLDNAMRTSARDENECKGRDGVWVDKDSGNVKRGCKNQLSDVTDAAACKAAGGEFNVTGKNGNQDVYTCEKKGQTQAKCNDGSAPDSSGKCKDGSTPKKTTSTPGPAPVAGNTGTCGEAKTVLIPSSAIDGCKDGGASAIGGVMKFVILLLTAGIGVVAVGGIVYGAILYTSARDNAGQVNQAITIIRNVVIGLLLYIFMISILNWLVPGGVFV